MTPQKMLPTSDGNGDSVQCRNYCQEGVFHLEPKRNATGAQTDGE